MADQEQIITLDITCPSFLSIKHSIKLISEHEIKNFISFSRISTITDQKGERLLGNRRMSIKSLGIFNLVNMVYKSINWLEFLYFHTKLTINNDILKITRLINQSSYFYSFTLFKNSFSISIYLINRYKSAI